MSLSKIARIVGVIGVAAAMAGCANSPIPLAENFELTTQKKVRSAGHWELLSRDVIEQTAMAMEQAGIAPGVDLYVSLPANPSHFDKAFREFLITELVAAGKSVRMSPEGAVRVSYDTQVVRHESHRPHFVPGQFTMITGGLYAMYGLRAEHLDARLAAGLLLAGAADYAASVNTGGPTHTEVILTTTVSSGDRYLVRKTDVYYLEDSDAFLFARVVQPNAKIMGVVAE